MFKIYDGREHFYQWDTDRKLIIEDPSIVEVHFCNRTDDCSLVCETYVEDGITLVNVPNILLQNDWCIRVYAFDGAYTKHEERYDVIARTKPADYAYEETEVLTWHTISEKVDEALGNTGYYMPSVDSDGNLTWEGSTEILPEVAAVNIKGAKGDKGDTGATGAQGLRGERGEKGERGETGPEGKPGKDGSIKFEELTDAQKASLKGDKGEQGERGLTGATGAAGKDGISVTHEWNGTTLIITSASGTTSQDLKGAKGDKGEKGDPGIKGEPGAIGAQGIQGEKGERGAQGIQGERGLKGDKGDTGKDGYTPVKGIDYWTAAEQQEIITATADAINAGFVTDGELETALKSYLSKPEAMGTYINNSRFDVYVSAQNDTYNKVKKLEENTYTKSEVDAKIAAGGGGGNADLTGYATEKYVDDAIAAIPQPDLTGYVTETELNGKGYTTMSAVEAKGYATTGYVDDAIANIPTGGGGSGSGKTVVVFDWNTTLTEEQLNTFSDIHTLFDEGGFAAVDSKYEIYANKYGTHYKMVNVTSYWYGGGYNAINIYFSDGLQMMQKAFKYNKAVSSNEYDPGAILTQTNYSNYISTGGGSSWSSTSDVTDGNLYNAKEIYIQLQNTNTNNIYGFSHLVVPNGDVLGNYCYRETAITTTDGMDDTVPYWYYTGSSISVGSESGYYVDYIAYK